MIAIKLPFAIGAFALAFVLPSTGAVPLSEPAVPYSVPEQPWNLELGHHRASVTVDRPQAVVWAHLPWRVQFEGMPSHQIIVVSAATGTPVRNVVRAFADRMAGDVLFEAAAAGDYFIYYLPLRAYQNMNDAAGYVPYACTADPTWRQSHGLTDGALPAGAWKKFPASKLTGFQARTALDRFDPMAVIASPTETATLVGDSRQPMLLFPEDRSRPIRMKRDLPLRWVESGPSDTFRGQAQQNEYYAYQVGVYAPQQALNQLSVSFSDLRSPDGAVISSAAMTCFNLGGTDSKSQPFTKTVNVAAGGVQALWCGVDVKEDQEPGIYHGTVTLGANGVPARQINVDLEVKPGAIAERGDNEPWRHSRLRWLNSTAGTHQTIPEPYTPLAVDSTTLHCLGRTITLAKSGLPATIASGKEQALTKPLRFAVETAGGLEEFQAQPLQWMNQSPTRVSWKGTGNAGNARLDCTGELEYDGHVRYRLDLTATKDLDLKDVRLELPMRPEAAPFILGAGHPGGLRPAGFSWAWQGPFNSFWLGSTDVGIQCKLLGGSYTGPMLSLYHPAPPVSWHNGGKGGLTVRERDGTVLATAFSGARQLKAGQALTFEFSLLVTPVKPLDTHAQLSTRYYHCGDNWLPDGRGNDPEPPADTIAAGVNVVNLHHASIYNPYINYPFLKSQELKDFTARMHQRKVKVKLYDTVRELTNMVTEIWALRSLGDEVYANGGGGGYAWCQEHLINGYQPAWFQRFGDSAPDAAMVTSGDSRWFNYYVEGIGWLVRNTGIDGIYLDDVSYDRRILQRVRSVMAKEKPGCLIDLHSNTAFSKGAANHYAEFFPYIDRPWFGESFNYHALTPDQWLVQVSGIPFGLLGEMLHEGGNPWRGAVYGLTNRLGWKTNGVLCDPRPVWKVWDQFGISEAKMIGHWESSCPVKTHRTDVLATAYVKPGKAMIAMASWAKEKTSVQLAIDWKALGISPDKAILWTSPSKGFQPAAQWKPSGAIPIEPGRGWLLYVDETGPPPGWDQDPDMANRPVLFEEDFSGKSRADWKPIVSPRPGTSVRVVGRALEIQAEANASALWEHELPDTAEVVECKLDRGTDMGETWGVGFGAWWDDGKAVRVNLRGPEGRFGVDATGKPQIFGGRFEAGEVALRILTKVSGVFVEAANSGEEWQQIASFPRGDFPGRMVKVRVGKMRGVEGTDDFSQPGNAGASKIYALKAFGPSTSE